jgi:hypothetical protein
LELPENTKKQKMEKNLKISTLSKRFFSMAKRLGKIIISEAFLPDQLTIKPFSTIGGHAGGKKYLYNGILFKLQTDWMRIYGGDFYAMKVRIVAFSVIHVFESMVHLQHWKKAHSLLLSDRGVGIESVDEVLWMRGIACSINGCGK